MTRDDTPDRETVRVRSSLRTKLLLLTLIPLVPLAGLNVGGLFYLQHLHEQDVARRLDRVEELWRARIRTVLARSERSGNALAGDKTVEQALRRNDWAVGREAARRAVASDPDLRADLVDDDGRLLAASDDPTFDRPVGDTPRLSRALAGEPGCGLDTRPGGVEIGCAVAVTIVGGVEGAAWVGARLDEGFLRRFGEQTQSAVVVRLPSGGASVANVPLANVPLVDGGDGGGGDGGPPAVAAEGDRRSYALRAVDVPLPGGATVTTWVGVDPAELAAAVERQLWTLGTTLAVLLIVILAVTLLLSHRIAAGIRFVVRKMRVARAGEYEKIEPVVGRDEIAFLGRGFNEMIEGLEERDFVRATFGRYMTPDVAKAILDDPQGLKLGGEARTVTILMCDLRGFTSFSAEHGPEEVVAVLNIWLARMAQAIEAHRGTINEFLGDAILALFGAPLSREDDALRAVACAIDMQRAMADVNARLARDGAPALHMGIGLATGRVVAGNIGSESRTKYAVVGQPVNLAARVESLTVGDDVLVAGSTLTAAGAAVDTGPPRHVTMKGAAEPIAVHPILGVGAPYDLRLPAAETPTGACRPLAAPVGVRVWPIDGKTVAEEALLAEAIAASDRCLELVFPRPGGAAPPIQRALALWSDVRLQVLTEPPTSDKLYGKVICVPGEPEGPCGPAASPARDGGTGRGAVVRLTHLPGADRAALASLAPGPANAADPAIRHGQPASEAALTLPGAPE